MKSKSDALSAEKRRALIKDMIVYFESEHEIKIGIIAAGNILDFFLQSVGSEIYNKGISDAKNVLESRMDEVWYDFDDLLDLP